VDGPFFCSDPRLLYGVPFGMRRRLRRDEPYKTTDLILDRYLERLTQPLPGLVE
jgi:hypothetical protein